jgi:hypothetical protein
MPLVFSSDPSRVVAQGGQCNPVTMYVALVMSGFSGFGFGSCAETLVNSPTTPKIAKQNKDLIVHPRKTQA